MKKASIILTCFLLFIVSGCSMAYKLDTKKLDENLANLKSSAISLETIVSTVEQDSAFLGEMESIYVNDMEEKFHIKGTDYFKDAVIRTSVKDEFMIYMVLDPIEGKLEEGKKALDSFFASLNDYQEQVNKMIKTSVDGYVVYILTSKNEEVLNKINEAKPLIFPSMTTIEKESFASKYQINVDDLDSVYYKAPMMSATESMVIMAKAKTGKSSEVKKQIEKVLSEKENMINYPHQKELFKNRLSTRLGSYLVYIVSIDNQQVLKAIEESKASE